MGYNRNSSIFESSNCLPILTHRLHHSMIIFVAAVMSFSSREVSKYSSTLDCSEVLLTYYYFFQLC